MIGRTSGEGSLQNGRQGYQFPGWELQTKRAGKSVYNTYTKFLILTLRSGNPATNSGVKPLL